MKPDCDLVDSMDMETMDPCEVYLTVGMLIIEGRVPELSAKGRMEGPHCLLAQGVNEGHLCISSNLLCKRSAHFKREMTRLWKNDIPLCIDVLLAPECAQCHMSTPGGATSQKQLILLERWNVQVLSRRVDTAADVRGLFQAVRSYLYFSQLSAWYNKTHGKAPVNVIYRVHAPGESEMIPFTEQSVFQSFPIPTISKGLGMKVYVSSMPRKSEIPLCWCSLTETERSTLTKGQGHLREAGKGGDEGHNLTPLHAVSANVSHASNKGAIPKQYKKLNESRKESGSKNVTKTKEKDVTLTATARPRKEQKAKEDRYTGYQPIQSDIQFESVDDISALVKELTTDYDYSARLEDRQTFIDSDLSIGAKQWEPPQSLKLSPPRGNDDHYGIAEKPLVSPMVLVSQRSPSQACYYSKGVIGQPKMSSNKWHEDLCEKFPSQRESVNKSRALSDPVYLKQASYYVSPSCQVRRSLFSGEDKDNDEATSLKKKAVKQNNFQGVDCSSLENVLSEITTQEKLEPDYQNDASLKQTIDLLSLEMETHISGTHHVGSLSSNGHVSKEKHFGESEDSKAVFYIEDPGDLNSGLEGIANGIKMHKDLMTGGATSSPHAAENQSLFRNLLKKELEQRRETENDRLGRPIPTAGERRQLRRSLEGSSNILFNRTGLPKQSSPAPLKKRTASGGSFDFDNSLANVRAIKNAISCSVLDSDSDHTESPDDQSRYLSTSAPASTNRLLGNFEESLLNGRIEPAGTVQGFTAEIGASGTFCPKHITLPVTAYFFSLSDDNAPSPYLGHINLELMGKKGYHVPNKGTIQVTLFNPNKTVVKMFVVMYDLTDMPANSRTFLRQRTVYLPVPSEACPDTQNMPSYLRYLIHVRFISSKSGRVYLHTDIRLIFARDKFEFDPSVTTYELRSLTEGPVNPKYSPKR